MALLNTNIGPERVQAFAQPIGNVSIPGAAISSAAFIISTSEVGAPVDAPTSVFSLDEAVETFGGPDEIAGDGYYALKGFYDNAGSGAQAIIVNVGSSPSVSDYLGTAANGKGLRALDNLDEVGMITIPGLSISEAYQVQSGLIDYSETVRAEFGASLSTSFSLLSIPQEINKSNTDTTLTTAQLIEITGSGPYVMNINIESSAVAASGTATIVDFSLLSGATFTLDTTAIGGSSTVLTEGSEWTAATDNDTTASSLASAIDAISGVSASAVGAVVTITADDAGVAGNSITMATSDAVNISLSGASLAGGLDGDVDLSSIVPGMIVTDSSGTNKFVISAVDDSADTVTVITDPSGSFTAGDDVLIKLPSAVTWKEEVINNPSKTAAWYFNGLVVTDESAGATAGDTLVVDPVGHAAGIIARIDANVRIGGHSHAPAGVRFAGIAGILGLQLSLSEKKDGEPLRLNFINRITSFPGAGNIIYGGYTADSGTSPVFTADEQLIQVMRSIQFIKASLEPGLRSFIWENFSPATQAEITAAISSFLRNNKHLFPAGLPESSQFVVIPVEATQDELDKGLLRVRLQLRINKSVRFIELALEFPLPAA